MNAFPSKSLCDNRKSAIQNRKLVGLLAILAALTVCGVRAAAQQPGKVPRIGFLISASTGVTAPYIEAFRQAMRDLGYVEGKNYVLEIRGGGAEADRLAHLAAELVRLKVDIIVAGGTPALRAAIKATSKLPIIMRTATDPVAAGLVPSLAHPGGNVTGLTSITTKLIGKQLELLAEVVPEAKHIAVLTAQPNQARFMATRSYKEMEAAARALGVKLQVQLARDTNSIDNAFSTIIKERARALIVIPSPLYLQHGERIINHAAKHRLPTIYYQTVFAENGGLMSYATNNADEYRRAAIYVDKILKGANPGDLPIEQPTKFELVINLKTAKQIGLPIPPNVLARADRVIK